MSLTRIIVAAVAVLGLVGVLLSGGGPGAFVGDGEPDVYTVTSEDPEMTAAISEARRTVSGLIAQLDTLRSSGAQFSVKVPLPTAEGAEHIWLGNLVYRDGAFHGVIDNVPVSLPSMAIGDPASARPDQISDWMVIRNGELYGGYTLYVYRAQLDAAQRREFDAGRSFHIPPEPRSL